MSLVDEQGRLLPAEYCNIKTLESLTKDRAKSPARRSPSRNGKKSLQYDPSSSPKLPTFVHEVSESDAARLTSPTALKPDANFVKQVESEENSTNVCRNGQGELKEVKPLTSSTDSFDPAVSLDHHAKNKTSNMELSEKSEDPEKHQLPKKPLSVWTTEDVCVWLDHIQLTNFKESFISKGATGKTLCNLSYETLDEKITGLSLSSVPRLTLLKIKYTFSIKQALKVTKELNLSNSRDERERFLAEVYRVQHEGERVNDDEEMDKEIEEALRGVSSHERNNVKATMRSPHWNAEYDGASTGSYASSSRTGSECGNTPLLEMYDDENRTEKEMVLQPKQVSNTSQLSGRNMASSQGSMPKSKKGEMLKEGDKRRKSRGKRISRFWNSFHHSGKASTVLDQMSPTPIYKNAFHNLMNSGPQGVIKVWTEMFLTDMQYVSLLVSYEATAFEVVKMVLEKSNASEDPECYRICEINEENNEYVLEKNESPLQRERQWSDPDNCRFELRWRNERLIEWRNTSGSVTQDLSLQKPDQEITTEQNNTELFRGDSNADKQRREAISDLESPESNHSNKSFQETAFDYNVELEYKNEAKEPDERFAVDGADEEVTSDEPLNTSDDSLNQITSNKIPREVENIRNGDDSKKESEGFESLVTDEKLSLPSGIDASSKESHYVSAEFEIPTSSEPGEEKGTTDQSTMIDEEQEYSQQLRKSSKKLSRRLKLQTDKTRHDEPGVLTGMDESQDRHERTGIEGATNGNNSTNGEYSDINGSQGPFTDYEGSLVDSKDTLGERLTGDHSGAGDDTIDGKVHGEQPCSKEGLSVINSDGHLTEIAGAMTSQEVDNLYKKIKELENENSLLIEESRNLKKSCRTFEGKSRLKERELEDLQEEKNIMAIQMQEMSVDLHTIRAENTELRTSLAEANANLQEEKNVMAIQMQEMSVDLHTIRAENTELRTSLAEANANLQEEKNVMAIQMQEMSVDLHTIRAENTELRTSLAEANAKLNDVDGWVTRDVFEDIRGQLSVSMEEVDRKEDEVRGVRKKMEEMKEENKKIKVFELEVEKLNERIKEDERNLEGMKKEVQEKLVQIRGNEREREKLRALIEEGQKEKAAVEKKLEEAESEASNANKNLAEKRKELQKNLSDREYEVLIMKEEKKELCEKLRSIESTVETLREDMKKKDSEHEAAIAEMKQQNDIKDESLSVTVSTLEQLVNERDQRINELRKKLACSGQPDSELQAKEQEYEQNKLYLKHLIAVVREKDPALLDVLNRTLSSRDSDDWC